VGERWERGGRRSKQGRKPSFAERLFCEGRGVKSAEAIDLLAVRESPSYDVDIHSLCLARKPFRGRVLLYHDTMSSR
jgi:hypothetical protein